MSLWRHGTHLLLALFMMGCASEQSEQTSIDVAVSTLRSTIANIGKDAEGTKVTATRASLLAGGFGDAPLLVARIPALDNETGLFLISAYDGLQIWQTADGRGTLSMRASGPVVNISGFGFDLQGADFAATEAALLGSDARDYARRYRHLGKDLTSLKERIVFCTFEDRGLETIEIFDRTHPTRVFAESCASTEPHPDGSAYAFENLYWQGLSDGVIWQSEQWISQDLGSIRLEKVF